MNKDLITALANNQALLDSLKEVLYSHFKEDEISTDMTNENIGQVTRARVDGRKRLDAAFQEIERHKSFAEKPPTQNPGR